MAALLRLRSGGAMPDEKTIRHDHNWLIESDTLEALKQAFEQKLHDVGYLAIDGQIVDATLVPAPKQRKTKHEKAAIKAGKSARQIWRGKPNKAEEQHAKKPHPSPQTSGKVDAQENGKRQRGKVSDP